MNKVRFLPTLVLFVAAVGVNKAKCLSCTNFTNVGETRQLTVSAESSPQFVCIQLNNTLEPIRIFVESENSTSRHPVLVTVRQPMGISSWTLPHVESGLAYRTVERTLCPLLNQDNTGFSVLIIDFSTTRPTPLSVFLSTSLVTPFRLEMNTPVTLEASPSGPSYLLYEFEDPPSDKRVRVNFLSMDNTSTICAIASIQTTFCPVVNVIDDPEHRGRFQTMRSIASITAKENDTEPHFGYFYVALSVLPNDGVDNSCLPTSRVLGEELLLFNNAVDNFNPAIYSGPDRTKRVVVTVELVNPNLPAAIVVPIVVYILFVIVAVVWISVTLFRRKVENSTSCCCQRRGCYDVERQDNSSSQEMQPPQQPQGPLPEGSVQASNGTEHISGNGVSNGNTSEETHKFQLKLNMAELGKIDDSPAVQKEYYHYAIYLFVIIAFYGIPAYQLVVTYQRLLFSSGNEDICYFNSLCAVPLDTDAVVVSAFNNLFSNIGYLILGVLYIGVACVRRRRYQRQEEKNLKCLDDQKQGVPQTFGIFYAIGLAMIGQALMSVAYHLCPSTSNYQFDATFMYIMAILGMFKVLTTRAPDLAPALHRQALFLMVIIVTVVLGEILFQYLAFRIVFMILYLLVAVYYSLEVYYRWKVKLNLQSLLKFYKKDYKENKKAPQHPLKFGVVLISLLLNTVIAAGIFPAYDQNYDFARYFLLIILANFIIYLLYYLVAKVIYKECFTLKVFKPIMYGVFAFCMWIVAIYFFTQSVTDTLVSPALSRDNNRNCLAFGFYDSHDFWHFTSSFALFFSFSILLTVDEGQESEPRSRIKTF